LPEHLKMEIKSDIDFDIAIEAESAPSRFSYHFRFRPTLVFPSFESKRDSSRRKGIAQSHAFGVNSCNIDAISCAIKPLNN
jgi:hypothetical protein